MDQRKSRRFKLQLPVSITRSGAERIKLTGQTTNISSAGVLFTAGHSPDPGGPIEYTITLSSGAPDPVSLRCIGKVVRSEPMPEDSQVCRVAATLERYEFVRDR
jgi:hypothetical protein